MSTTQPRYSLTELAGLAGVTTRTVRYYMSQGLLPSVGTSGPGAKYDDRHLARLRLVRRLQREHLPLAEIRQQLEDLDDDAIAALVDEPTATPDPKDSALDYIRRLLEPSRPARSERGLEPIPAPGRRLMMRTLAAPREPPVGSALAGFAMAREALPAPVAEPPAEPRFERSQWERIPLAPDVELHVRRPLPRPLSKQVDRLVSIARDLLEEDPS
jgi:DNA-binding transcriptional MerR regulator